MKTTKQRLADYRAKAAKYNNINNNNWRYWRINPWQTPSNNRGPKGQIYSKSLDQYGQVVSDDKTNRDRDAVGWYADNFQCECVYGAVVKMHSSKGTWYIPATYCTGWDGTVHYVNDMELVYKDAEEYHHERALNEALRSARHYAEREAEEAREEDAKYQAERQIEEARETIIKARALAHEIITELRTITLPASLCGIAREKLTSLRAEAHESIETIRKLRDDYWQAVY